MLINWYTKQYKLFRDSAGKVEMDREVLAEQRRWNSLSNSEKATEWALRHRWHIFLAGWAASMGASWMILRRNKTQTFSQKIVQARVYVCGFLSSCAIRVSAN